MGSENIGIDLNALRHAIEGHVVRSIINSSMGSMDAQTRKTLSNAIAVFERHGIGAATAIQILIELGESMK